MIRFLFSFLLLAGVAFTQTKTDISQVRATSTANTVFVVVPGVGFVPALLGTNLVLTNNAGVYTLNVVQATPVQPEYGNNVTRVGVSPTQSFSTSVAGIRSSLTVYRNGVLQTESEDYIAVVNADNTITVNFTNNVVQSNDLIRLRYTRL